MLLTDDGARVGGSAGTPTDKANENQMRPFFFFYTKQWLLTVSLHGSHHLGRLWRLVSGFHPQDFWLRNCGWGLEIPVFLTTPQ